MLSFDEDITTELDKVVCRLMKLALHSSTGRQNPPPARWMQCKLLDLLTLTEKAIRRRKKYFIESFPLTIDKQPDLRKQDNRVKELVDKYRHIIQPLEKMTNTDDDRTPEVDIEDEFLSTTSNDFTKENEYTVGMSPSLVIPRPVFSTDAFVTPELYAGPNPLERTKAWLAEDRKLEPFSKHDKNYESISSADTDNSVSKMKHKKSIKKKKISNKNIREPFAVLAKTSSSKTFCKFNIKREYKRHSKTQITKKVVRKRSNYNNTVENPDCEYSSADYDSYVAASRRKIDERHTLNMAVNKPIPESFITICQPDLNAEKRADSLTASNNNDKSYVVNIPSCLSATLDSHHIDIITQDYEETIALRRTIATDTKVPEIKRTHGVGHSFDDNDTKICTKHEVSTESVQAQTIFLNDINEPSTSKGIRHNISTDVQCGPDILATYPLITPATSVVKMPHVYSTGIKINDVGAGSNVKRTDFGTSTQETSCYKTITPRLRTVGIKIKDSDENLYNHTECSTMTVPDFATKTFVTGYSSPLVFSPVSFNGTKLIKPISSTLKIENMDSGSDFCAPSIASTAKTHSYYTTHSATASNVLMEVLETKDQVIGAESASKRLILSCGPVNVHSYKDTQVAKDVVYQSEWQRYKPNKNTQKKSINYAKSRSRTNASVIRTGKEILKEKKVTSKEKIYRKIQEKKETEVESKKAMQIRNVKLRKVSQEEKSAEVKKPRASKSIVKMSNKGIPRPTKMITKVASRHAISENTAKNAKSTFTIKRSGISVNVNTKKEIDKPHKLKKSYIPLYLKRALNRDKLNKSLDSATDAILDSKDTLKVAEKIAPLKRSNTDEIKRDLLKFGDDLHVNMSYVVCRNDMEDKIKTPDDQVSENSNSKPLDVLKRSHSPSHSVNSSTCSSPNSIATVRAASARAKATTKRHSAQPYKVNVTNSESDNLSPPRIKKVVKRYKVAKKPENKDMGNKENIPESTKNFVNKDKEKIIKSSFAGRPKSICVAQVEKECSSPPLTQKAHLILNKSNVKIPTRKDSDEKLRANSPSVSKKLKSTTSSIYDDFIQNESESYKTLDSSNMVLVLEPQQNYENLTKARNVSRKSSAQIAIQSNHNLLDELVNESSLHSNTSTILDSMRHILEETLDRVLTSHSQLHCSSQHTVVLSCDDVQKADFDKVTSPEMKTSINLVETGQSDPKNTLDGTFDSILGGESTVSLNDTRLTVTDMDLLSFKSITSDSKYSEYYLADNEFNTSQEGDQEQTQDTMSVQDLFERKEPHLMQSKPGALAIQAFSGFSLDAEPVAGDQPDSIAIVDSETGSMAVEFNRQATSEELFISGRSSESYGSCVLDDDSVVPNWLFQLISHQQSVEEEGVLDPLAEPFDEPHYDGNGNVVEPSLFGVAAGAGDGRGMHSDHSQDSSGRGTSLSSSDTSSGLQSDISMEQLRDPMTSSAVAPMIEHPHFLDRSYEIEGGPGSLTASGSRDTRRTIAGVSDIDADISSIDTDATESF